MLRVGDRDRMPPEPGDTHYDAKEDWVQSGEFFNYSVEPLNTKMKQELRAALHRQAKFKIRMAEKSGKPLDTFEWTCPYLLEPRPSESAAASVWDMQAIKLIVNACKASA